jgi:hypothetical protein
VAKLGRRIPFFNDIAIDYDVIRYGKKRKSRLDAAWDLAKLSVTRVRERTRSNGAAAHRPVENPNGVSGVYRDNWLAPRVTMRRHHSAKGPLVLMGEAARDCTIRVKSGKRLILQQAITGNQLVRIEFSDAGKGKPVTLEFDRHIEMSGRKLAFLVQHTNCFSEAEI